MKIRKGRVHAITLSRDTPDGLTDALNSYLDGEGDVSEFEDETIHKVEVISCNYLVYNIDDQPFYSALLLYREVFIVSK
jgi:hypothetical protein